MARKGSQSLPDGRTSRDAPDPVEGLEQNFRAAADEYVAFCAAENKAPDTPFKGTFNVLVGRELHMRAALLAAARRTKLNTVVQEALEEYLNRAS